MSSQSEDIGCTNIKALTNTLKCNRFIFDVTLDISYVADERWSYSNCLMQTSLATIVGQIAHKYKQLKVFSWVIAESLYKKLLASELDGSKDFKGIFSTAGQYVDRLSGIDYSEIIYDWFSYDGFMTIPTSGNRLEIPPVCLQSTIRFFLSPTVPIAHCIYHAKGYENITDLSQDDWKIYENIMSAEVDHEKEYNHLQMWHVAYNAFESMYNKT